MDFTEGRPGKGGEWVMTTSAGEPMILPYDPPAWDPQPQKTTSLLFETSKKNEIKYYIPIAERSCAGLPYLQLWNSSINASSSTLQYVHTGSFRKNGKSKMVFMGTKFHEKMIFSAFFSRELATNLHS